MCGKSWVYNRYVTTHIINPLFPGFSSSPSINKEIINFTIQDVSGRFRDAYYIPGLSFWGVFCVNCGNRIDLHLYEKQLMELEKRFQDCIEMARQANLQDDDIREMLEGLL